VQSGSGEGSEENGLFSFRIEFSIKCPRCDGHVPLDGPLEKVQCPSCRSFVDIPHDYWTDTINSSCSKMQIMEKGGGRGSILMGTFWGNLELARFDPYCNACKEDFEDPWHLQPGTVYRCRKCEAVYPVDSPPDWFQKGSPRVKILINALHEKENLQPDEVVLESFSCPSCAATLDVNGESRIVKCNYCGVDVYLPDQIWHRFHPGRRKRRWFVICEYSDEDETT
jgi:DNA-directed RNA polymerase subunit RPC12/RpoP